MTLETWLNLNKSPAETRKEATERYLGEQGIFDPAEKQKVLDEVEDYRVVTPLEQQSDFTQDTYGDWTPPQADYTPTEDEYNADPDWWDSLGRGGDLAQAAVFGFGEGPVAGFLDDIGLESASAGLKDWSREGRLEQERQAAQVAPAKSVEQEVAENPDSFYKYFDKDMMTVGQMAESAPTSLTPWLAAVPLALATPYLASAAGIAATGTIGSKLIAAGVGMGAGNLASSAIVSSEAYDRGKSDPIIRQQLGVDPNKEFKDLSNSDQQKVDRVATDLSQTSFGHRLYTAGLVEMASYIPYGHAMVRLALDTGLGTASEVWDRTLYSEDAVTALIENGVPAEKAEELREAIIQAGPGFRETLIAALQQEFVMGGAATGIESMVGQTAPQVNPQATASKKLREEVARIQELNVQNANKEEQKKLDYDRKFSAEEERQKLRDRSAAFNQEQKAYNHEQVEQLKANQKELLENVKHANKLEELAIKEQTPDLPPIDQEFRKAEAKKKATRDRRVDRVYKELEAKDAKKAEKEKQSRLKSSLKRNEVIARKKKALENREKKLFGVKGEKGRFTSKWKGEQFVEYDDIKQKRLELKQLEKEQKNDKGEALLTQNQVERNKKIDANARRKKAEDIVDNKFYRSALQSEGDYKLQKGLVQRYVDDLGSRSDKYKGIYTVLNNNSAEELATILKETGYEGDALAQAEQLLSENNAWVYKDHIYVNEDNIRGANKEEAFTNLAKIVAFHEPIAHLGLKEFLQSDYEPFLDNFFGTNKEAIQQWAENEAITDEGDAAYLGDTEFNDLSESQQRDLAEEFLANKFVELGILDPDIISRTADALVSSIKGVLTPLNKRVSTTEARAVLAEIQRQYLGGKKNIITGDLFDPANWTMKGIEVAADEDKVEAYKRYLKEQGVVIERGEKEFIKKEFAPRPTEPETVKAEVLKKAPYKIPINASKRIVTPLQAEKWKKDIGRKRGKGRKPKSPILMAMANKLEKGTVSYEEYQKKADEILPINRFKSVPKAANDAEVLSSIDSEQYREGLILGEDSLTGTDVVNVRLDIPAYTRYDSWVATITHGKDTIYGAAVRLKDVTFKAPLMGALRIAQGARKYPLATMKGTWQKNSVADIEEMAKGYINDPAWVQIGYNPERQSSFYIREDKNGETKGTPLESAEEIIQVGAFILAKNPVTKDTPSYTTKEGVTFKFSKKLTPMQRKVYSLLKPTEKSLAYTKTAKNRPEEKQKRPTAKLQKFTLPKRANGKSPIIYVGGGKTTENWKDQVESVLSKSQIKDAIQWYPRVKNAFVKEFGKDRAPNMMLAWALANKAESPLGAMKNVLRAKENLANTINPELRKKGGLNDDVITKILKDEEATKGSGVKLYDFVDAMLGVETRNWTGFDPAMGAPAVVDRHTWRDRGWIDNTVVNFIKDNLPEDKRAKSLKSDKPNPNVTPIEYEETASWLRDITNDLNNEKWMGRSNWTPDQTQAVGWMAVTELLEIPGGTSQSVLAETGRSVAFETFWGTDSPFRNKYEKSFNQLTKEQQVEFLYNISDKVADIAIERTGVTEKDRIKGWGFWENTPMNPNMIINISATDQGIANLMDTIGLLAQQDAVVAFGPKHNAVGVGIDVYDKNGKFSDPELLDKVYRGLLKASPWDKGGVIQGASQTTVKGVPALRIILANTKAKGKKVADKIANNKKLQKQRAKELSPTINELEKTLGLDIIYESFQAQMFETYNDWKNTENGYIQRINQNFRPTVSRRIQDRDATTIENEIKKRFDGFGIKYSKRTIDGRDGTASQRTYEGRLDVESDGQSHFVHWSNSPDLIEIDPSYHGTGIKGAELELKKQFPEEFTPRAFIGLPGYSKEMGLGKNMYEIQLDPNTLYDGNKDPDGFILKVKEELGIPKTAEARGIALVKYENSIKEAGYVGYFNISAQIAALFNPTKVKFTKEIIGPSTYAPSIRVKASKRVRTAKELETEWRDNLKGDVAPPPPRKKDKVTISPQARIKASDISPDAILNPDGNIKASRILASRAARHAISTRDTGKKVPLRYKLAEKLTRRLRSQGTLPDSEKYKALRRIASGTIVKAEETGRVLYEALKKTKQPETIYRYFTEKGFDPAKIKNVAERKAAVDAKAKIQQIGVDLVGMGLMDEGARLQYEGQYLPQMYLKYMIPDEAVIKVRGGGIKIDAKYLKKRRDIPEGIRKLILGQVKDPAYLATRATTVPIKDMAIINWLQQIAANPDWVLPSTLVKFDLLGEMKNAALDINVQKELELKDTFGVNVSAHWLANEAERIFNRTKYMPNLTDTEFKIIKDVTTKMEKMAKEVNDNMSVDSSKYSIVPKTAKYGMLGGMAVRKEIADDIFGGMSMTTGDISKAEAIFGDGGKVGDYNRLWKWAKVSANPPSWVRNFVSNMILMNMGGVAFYKMPGLIISSLRDMRKAGSDKGALHQLTKDLGLTSGNFSNVELGRIEREFKDLQVRMNKEKAGPMAVLGMIKGAFNKIQDVTSDTYGGIDSLGKMMMVKNAMNEAGLKVKDLKDYTPAEMAKLDDIALNAEKWLFDYSNPLPSVKWLRRAPFGAPFISFTSFVAPLMLETAITKPWKFLPYYALGFAAKEFFKETQDLDEEQYEGLKVSMSEYLREKAYTSVFPSGVVPWPYLDENGRVVFQDISYLFPWGMFSEMGGEVAEGKYFDALKTAGLMGGPTLNVASAVLTGIDPFTRQPIVDSTGTFAEQGADVMWYAFNLTMPPMFHGIGQGPNQGYGAIKRLTEAYTGQLTKDGEARFTKSQAWLRMFGQNVTPIAVPEGRNKQLRYEYSRLKKLERLAKRDLKNSIIMQESQEDIQEKLEAYKEKILKARKELMKKVQISSPPITLLRQREEALKKMRQRLLKQKSA